MNTTGSVIPAELRPAIPAWAVMTPARIGHVVRVAELVWQWSMAMGVPDSERHRWLKAVWLHDALRDAPVEELDRLAPGELGPPELRHGPAAAAQAEAEGERDRGILDAVRYHSIGLADWDMVGRVLYCADFLEPGRSFDREARADLARRFPGNAPEVVREVVRRRMAWLVRSDWRIPEPTWRFWNSLAGSQDG
jgi:HD superfamily phosphohydrolase YqeK